MANLPMQQPAAAASSPAIPIRRTDDSSGSGGGPGLGSLGAGGGVGAPIAIPGSLGDHHGGIGGGYRDRHRSAADGDDYSSDDESSSDGGVLRENFLSGSFMGGDVLDVRDGTAVMVGSLPSSRYERRRAAATNGLGGGGVGGGLAQSLGAAGIGGGGMARSLPPPRAPWLHARELSDDRLSRVPQITLPESATEGMVPSSLPYGSLRESRFSHYHQRGHHPRSGGEPERHVRFAGDSPAGGASKRASDGDDHDQYPSSLPAYTDAGSEMARRRWQREAATSSGDSRSRSGPSPLALGIGGGIGGRSGSGGGGGIGAAIGDSPPIAASSSDAAVGSLSAQLGGLAPPSSGGIGEAVEGLAAAASTAANQLGDDGNAEVGRYEGDGGYGSSGLYDDQGDRDDGDFDGEGSGSGLSSSLTALNILETAKATPGSLGVALSPQEMEAARIAAAMGGIADGTAAAAVAAGGGTPQQLPRTAAAPFPAASPVPVAPGSDASGMAAAAHQPLSTAAAPFPGAAPQMPGAPGGYPMELPVGGERPPTVAPGGYPTELPVGGERPPDDPDHFEAFDLDLDE